MSDFERLFKVTTLLALEAGGDVGDCFMPKLENCVQAHEAGDYETARGMLNFIADKLVETLECKHCQ